MTFLCAILLTWGETSEIDTPGILQVMWMVHANDNDCVSAEGISEKFDITQAAEVEDGASTPSDFALRKAGMVKMRLHARRRILKGTSGSEHGRTPGDSALMDPDSALT